MKEYKQFTKNSLKSLMGMVENLHCETCGKKFKVGDIAVSREIVRIKSRSIRKYYHKIPCWEGLFYE